MVGNNIMQVGVKAIVLGFLGAALLVMGASSIVNAQQQTEGNGEVHGRVFRDVNANGVRDTEDNEPANRLNDWDINLYDSNWDFVETTITSSAIHGSHGAYRFSNLPWGTYFTCVELPAGWTQTQPNALMVISGVLNNSPNVGIEAEYCRTATVIADEDGPGTAEEDEREREMNFGVIEQVAEGEIRVHKVIDDNGNGLPGWSGPEAHYAGWTMRLYQDDGDSWNFVEEMVTNGLYYEDSGKFVVPVGDYVVCEVQQPGYEQSFAFTILGWLNYSDANVVANESGAGDEAQDCIAVTVEADAYSSHVFGNFQESELRVHMVIDADNDGAPDWSDEETHEAGWTIRLYNEGWVLQDSVVTTGVPFGGSAMFHTNPGNYFICAVMQDEYEQTFARTILGWLVFPVTEAPNLSGETDEGEQCIPAAVTSGDISSYVFGAFDDEGGLVEGDTDENDNNNEGPTGVLGDSDTNGDNRGEVLAETGLGALPYIVIGALMILVPTALAVEARRQD